eukprot:scpid59562/ scgid23944/ 
MRHTQSSWSHMYMYPRTVLKSVKIKIDVVTAACIGGRKTNKKNSHDFVQCVNGTYFPLSPWSRTQCVASVQAKGPRQGHGMALALWQEPQCHCQQDAWIGWNIVCLYLF